MLLLFYTLSLCSGVALRKCSFSQIVSAPKGWGHNHETLAQPGTQEAVMGDLSASENSLVNLCLAGAAFFVRAFRLWKVI